MLGYRASAPAVTLASIITILFELALRASEHDRLPYVEGTIGKRELGRLRAKARH